MEIEGREVDEKVIYLCPVTYVPGHANGNAGHPDCELGVIVGVTENSVRVLGVNEIGWPRIKYSLHNVETLPPDFLVLICDARVRST